MKARRRGERRGEKLDNVRTCVVSRTVTVFLGAVISLPGDVPEVILDSRVVGLGTGPVWTGSIYLLAITRLSLLL